MLQHHIQNPRTFFSTLAVSKKIQLKITLKLSCEIFQGSKKARKYGLPLSTLASRFLIMEVAGIEPASENPLVKTSPITFGHLKFPRRGAGQQAPSFGSFIKSFYAAKLRRKSSPYFRRRLPS